MSFEWTTKCWMLSRLHRWCLSRLRELDSAEQQRLVSCNEEEFSYSQPYDRSFVVWWRLLDWRWRTFSRWRCRPWSQTSVEEELLFPEDLCQPALKGLVCQEAIFELARESLLVDCQFSWKSNLPWWRNEETSRWCWPSGWEPLLSENELPAPLWNQLANPNAYKLQVAYP